MLPTTWDGGSRVFGHSAAVALFALLFVLAISAVFFGFIGYYSRVSLSNELRQNRGGTSVDLLFMSVDQITKDQTQLVFLRQEKNRLEEDATQKIDDLRQKAYGSSEFKAYSSQKATVTKLFNANHSRFADDYWKSVSATLFRSSPEGFETEIALWTVPSFREGTSDDEKKQFYDAMAFLIDDLSAAYQSYDANYQQPIYQLLAAKQRATDPIIAEMRAIFTRYPQLATADDRKTFIDIDPVTPEERKQLSEQRAIIHSFDNLFVGWTRKILEWPTIASTLLVTLATGWLGGLVNFMGAAARAHGKRDESEPEMPGVASLFRRCFLGITAALGIFLAAGAGLLILTAQNAGAPGGAPIELSPYFVAFLAFISGFLADDAFARLAAAGRKLFEVKEKAPDADSKSSSDKNAADQAGLRVSPGQPNVVVSEAKPAAAVSSAR